MTIEKKDNYIRLLFVTMFSLFVILKTQRGFSGSESDGGIWNIFQLCFLMAGIIFLYLNKALIFGNKILRIYTIFAFFIWTLSFFPFFLSSKQGISETFHFLTIPYGCLTMICFYCIGRFTEIKKYWYFFYVTFLASAAILFFAMRDFRLFLGDQGALADVYYIVALLPLIFIYTPQKLSIIPYLIVALDVMMTGKRAAFFILAAILVIYFMSSQNKDSNNSLIKNLVFFIIVAGVTVYLVQRSTGDFNLNMFDRLERLDEDGGSGRAIRWGRLMDMFASEPSVLPSIVGYGYGFCYKFLGGHAHNDFLEFFCNFGIIALVLYLFFFISMLKEIFHMYRSGFIYRREFACSFIVALFMALFSFYATDCTHVTCSSVCIGLLLAEWDKSKESVDIYIDEYE